MSSEAICISAVAIVKALPVTDGRRLIEVEASNECVDREGDVILQEALLGSAGQFVSKGVIDIDHISEVGARYGIPNTDSWIIGRPIEVLDLGGKRTAVRAELFSGRPKADDVWMSMSGGDPAIWRASIYGFPTPGGVINASSARSPTAPDATRYIVKALDWKSLALTKSPVNDSITHHARIVAAKAFMKSLPVFAKGEMPLSAGDMMKATQDALSPFARFPAPKSRGDLMDHWEKIMKAGLARSMPRSGPLYGTVAGFREYFSEDVGLPEEEADICALALGRLLS